MVNHIARSPLPNRAALMLSLPSPPDCGTASTLRTWQAAATLIARRKVEHKHTLLSAPHHFGDRHWPTVHLPAGGDAGLDK